jgi:hypothetical protein
MQRRYAIAAGGLLALAILIFIYARSMRFGANPPAPAPSASAAPTAPPTPIPQHEVYVANMGDHSILGFAIDSRGQVAATPTRVIRGPSTGLHNPFDVVTDSAERIYVANLGDPPGSGSNVTVYSATAGGDAQPIRVLDVHTGPFAGPLKVTSVAIRRRPEGVLVAAQIQPPSAGGGGFLEFSATVGQDTPIAIVADPTTPLGSPAGLGLDGNQRIHVVDSVTPRIIIYPEGLLTGDVDLVPETVIEGSATGLNNPIDAALDQSANIYVVNRGSLNPNVRDASITVYAAGSGSATAGAGRNVQPIRMIGSLEPIVNLVDPVGIAIDSANSIYLLQGGSLKVFKGGVTNDPMERQVITGAISNPGGLWVR